jgi:hypothetical protein
MRNVRFIKTGFTGQTDFNVVQYSATSNGLLRSNQFCFQADIAKVHINHI